MSELSVRQLLSDSVAAVKTKLGEDSFTWGEYPAKLAKALASDGDTTKKTWTRPADWPNLDKITFADSDEAIYYTVNCKDAIKYYDLGTRATVDFTTNNGAYTVDIGHIGDTGFVTDTTSSYSSVASFSVSVPIDLGDYVVMRVTPSGTNHITKIFVSRYAPILDIYGQLPYLTTVTNNSQTATINNMLSFSTCHIKMQGKAVNKVTTLYCMFYACRSLQNVDFSGWNTTNWAVTSLANIFQGCYSLQSVDFSGWDTTNWAVTGMGYMFYDCYSLQNVDFSGWDTTNWEVTSLAFTFYECHSLQSVDFSGWDTTNWKVTSLSYMFFACHSLQSVDVSGWNTTNWKVTALNYMLGNCYSLQNVDFSGWDTTNWAVTGMGYMFGSCHSLQSVDFSNWSETWFALATDLSACTKLTAKTLNALIALLPTVTSATTLTIGSTNKAKLTADEIAVATNKGWTVS